MQYLKLENVSKSYGDKILFENLSLSISQGQKIALIAKNGSGKSTLLRVIAGTESAEGDHYKVEVAKGLRIGILQQQSDFDPKKTIEEIIFDADNIQIKTYRAYQTAQDQNDLEALDRLSQEMDKHQAWSAKSEIEETLNKLKLRNIQQKINQLSGGQVKRVALAKLFLEKPDFMILDEPTNHLDIEIIEWLEEYLQNPNITLFMVTHDRYFLDRVCSEIIELDQGTLVAYRGNYSQYLEKKALKEANDHARLDKLKKLVRKELDWIRKQPKARGTKEKSRVDKFYDLKEESKIRLDDDKMKINIKSSRLGSKILELHAVSKSYDEKLFEGFSYKFRKGEKVGLVGPNGAGKSTLISVIMGEVRADAGKIVVGDTIKFGYYSQHGIANADQKRVIDVVRDIAEYIPLEKGQKLTAESLLERFMFPRSQQQVRVSELSGGEKRRLYLLTILMDNPNFLILDEPTNDLDIVTLQVLEEYLEEFPGCLIVITHDRFFLDKVVDHIFIMEGEGKIKDYNGKYSEYRLNKKSIKQDSEDAKPQEVKQSKLDFEERKKLKNQVRKLERQIEDLQIEKSNIQSKFISDSGMPVEEIEKLSKRLGEINQDIDQKEEEWMTLSENLEE